MTSPATWSLDYDFLLTDTDDMNSYNLDINGYASIEQNTNEDWKNVDITLTTASITNIVSHTSPYRRGVYFQPEQEEEEVSANSFQFKKMLVSSSLLLLLLSLLSLLSLLTLLLLLTL